MEYEGLTHPAGGDMPLEEIQILPKLPEPMPQDVPLPTRHDIQDTFYFHTRQFNSDSVLCNILLVLS